MKSEASDFGGREGIKCGTLDLNSLPQDCIATVLSFTSPRDVCKLSVVSTTFKSAAESDAVWDCFLPPEYLPSLASSLSLSSKKELYFWLCDNPFLIDDGLKSLSLERGSGKKCFMLSARDITIIWSSTPAYWRWISIPESRFQEVAELIGVCWFEIRAKISTSMLSPTTHYKAYLVFKVIAGTYGFEGQAVEVGVGVVGGEVSKRTVYLVADGGQRHRYRVRRRRFLGLTASEPPAPPRASEDQYPKGRVDGWLEVELGEFFNHEGMEGELEMWVLETKGGNWKHGLVVQGIEMRPTNP